ncbi:MAG TPA: PH domain-containing protein [Chitinophagales bacterium]|nr:PH domain-containing protein [Chitinophagales bacterium]
MAKRSNSLLSGPALSLDRMEIVYNLGKRIIISPENPEKFVADLKKHHPQIVYPDEKAL